MLQLPLIYPWLQSRDLIEIDLLQIISVSTLYNAFVTPSFLRELQFSHTLTSKDRLRLQTVTIGEKVGSGFKLGRRVGSRVESSMIEDLRTEIQMQSRKFSQSSRSDMT